MMNSWTIFVDGEMLEGDRLGILMAEWHRQTRE
jgi:hypothetical protein